MMCFTVLPEIHEIHIEWQGKKQNILTEAQIKINGILVH